MKIIRDAISRENLLRMAAGMFGNMVKDVVDVEQGVLAVDAELHADLEAALLQAGSLQKNLWGIILYPELKGDEFVELDSMINMRPSQYNKSRGVEDESPWYRIVEIATKRTGG